MILPLFLENPKTLNIELGAGCGNFGVQYYAPCFISDYDTNSSLSIRCNGTFHTQISCDAHAIPCEDSRFEKVILCNPYGYGFRDREQAAILFNELHRVLANQGQIIIITSRINSYSAPERVESELALFNKSTQKFSINTRVVDCNVTYSGYKFYTSDSKPTNPSCEITLTCIK